MVLVFHVVTLRWAQLFLPTITLKHAVADTFECSCCALADGFRLECFVCGFFCCCLLVCFHYDGQRHLNSRCTITNNSTKHFNPKLACHGLYELQEDNKAVVYFGLKCPSVVWRNNKRSFSLQVESPLAVDAVLGESAFSVTDDKVSITELRVHAVSGLTLSLQPSPGNSHTMVAKATGLQTLTAPKQVQHNLSHGAEKRNNTITVIILCKQEYVLTAAVRCLYSNLLYRCGSGNSWGWRLVRELF